MEKSIERTARLIIFVLMAGMIVLQASCDAIPQNESKPNIIIIYADDVGYGDIGVYGATRIPTPEIDRLAAGGAMFTNAYCMASTCTPSRYSLLTGMYSFRNPDAEILPPDAGMIITPGSGTMAEILRDIGYRTGIIGKWHLGIGDGNTDWNKEIPLTPLDVGFDVSFVIPSTNDRVPTVWLDGNRVYNLDKNDDPLRISNWHPIGNLPTGVSHPELLKYPADAYHSGTIVNGLGRIGFMDGGQSAWWDDEMLGMEILQRSLDFIRESQDDPFFLFMPLHQNHTPRVPHPKFVGKSEIGVRGDHVVEIDYIVGETVKALEEMGIRENTLIIFSSDNGPVVWDSYYDGAVETGQAHSPSGPYRGGKYLIFEGGTRVPTIVNWPARVKSEMVSAAILSQVDLLASLARLVDGQIPEGAARDSQDQLEAWLGESDKGRSYVIQQGLGTFAIRKGDWKLIMAGDTPGWVDHRHNHYPNPLSTPLPPSNSHLLFNLKEDPSESNDLSELHPQIVEDLMEQFYQIKGTE